LTVNIVSVNFAATVPTLLDLVTYTPYGLGVPDYNSPPLVYSDGTFATRSFNLFDTDTGSDVSIGVTSLMREVQVRGLPEFQVRFLLDFVPLADGLVGIDDRPAVAVTAPMLVVRYYL
jgi:hypothetical protein